MTRSHARLLIFAMVVALVPAVGCDKPSTSSGTSAADAKTAGAGNSATAPPCGAPPAGNPASSAPLTAQEVLEKMAAAYKNAASYEDFGSLEFRQDPLRESRAKREPTFP